MKKASIIFMVSMFVIALCSCSSVSQPTEIRTYDSMYSITEIGSKGSIYVDAETNVMYWYRGLGYGAGLEVMLNADGMPKLAN